jgi:uncharacterized lipoprotein YmbA
MTLRSLLEQKKHRQILAEQANELLRQAQRMPNGLERDLVVRRAQSIQIEADAEKWADSLSLQPPT